MVSHGVGDGEVVVERGGGVSVLHLRVVEVTVELLLHSRHIFQLGNAADGNLLPSVSGGPRTSRVSKLCHGYELRRRFVSPVSNTAALLSACAESERKKNANANAEQTSAGCGAS